jgi:hypothetical protein
MQASINTYDNFVNSINSDETKEQYVYCLTQFLKYCQMNLDHFLKSTQDEISNLIVNYLLQSTQEIGKNTLHLQLPNVLEKLIIN